MVELLSMRLRRPAVWLAVGAIVICVGARATPAYGGVAEREFVEIHFETELLSLDLTGPPIAMPLASDPGFALPDTIEGYGFVDSLVHLSLSSEAGGPRSLGHAWAYSAEFGVDGVPTGDDDDDVVAQQIDPNELDGQLFFVDSFFDVFFDITVTDVDSRAGRDFAGMPDGASIMLPNNGPAQMWSFYDAVFDKDAPTYGLIPPPEVAPYIGHFNIEIPLGGDINGNGENDKIKFTVATHAAGDGNRVFVSQHDGTIIEHFDSAAVLDGLVVDESTDPPFSISLTGPTTAQSLLLNPVPVPGAVWLGLSLLGGMGAVGAIRRRKH